MNWDQIEIKWTEMAWRLRADVPMAGALDRETNEATFSKDGSPASDLRVPPTAALAERAAPEAIRANAE